jgi:hypothetical protein
MLSALNAVSAQDTPALLVNLNHIDAEAHTVLPHVRGIHSVVTKYLQLRIHAPCYITPD